MYQKDYDEIVHDVGGELYEDLAPKNCQRLHNSGSITEEMEYSGYHECPECGRSLDR